MNKRKTVTYLLESQSGWCANEWCCAPLRPGAIHLDHKIPRSRGGDGAIENLQLLCAYCNNKKGALTDEEFYDAEEKVWLDTASYAGTWFADLGLSAKDYPLARRQREGRE